MAKEVKGICPDPKFGFDELTAKPLPEEWDFMSHAVENESKAGQKLLAMVQESLPKARLIEIRRFGNRFQWAKFQHAKKCIASSNKGDPNVKLLFHGTADPTQIIGRGLGGNATGFDSRLSAQGAYGFGAYFARCAAYPVFIWPHHQNEDGSFTFIVAEVALGAVYDYGNAIEPTLRRAPKKMQEKLYDSVRGTENSIGLKHAGNSAFGEQYVIYEGANAYAHFLVTIELPSGKEHLIPGAEVALYSTHERKFIQMAEDGKVTPLAGLSPQGLEPWRAWERFTVVDAGNSKIALHCGFHNRFLRVSGEGVDGYGEPKDVDKLPSEWTWERFTVVDAGRGEVALHNTYHNCFIRILGDVDTKGGKRDAQDLPVGWASERFLVIPHPI